jgi:exodeoxyribonuclease VII small subunit
MPAKKQLDYQTASSELDSVLAALQQPDIAVDEAVKLYEQGTKLIKILEDHVATAENTLEKLQLQASKDIAA